MRKLLLATAAATFVASAGSAFAQETASDSFDVTATAQEAITITCDPTLSFGTFAVASGNGAGNVSIAATAGGAQSTNATGVVLVSGGSSVGCTVGGEDGGDATVSVNSDSTAVTLTADGSADELNVTLTQSAYDGTNSTFHIGGDLAIPANFAGAAGKSFDTYTANAIDVTVTD